MNKKVTLLIAILLVVCLAVTCMVACEKPDDGGNGGNGGKTTYNIKVWVSEVEGVAEIFEAQIARFNATKGAEANIEIKATVEGMSEGDAATQVISDVASAPDLYCFAQDQLARLVQAKALARPSANIQARIRDTHDAGSVNAASVAGDIYAYPLTADNGYFMYYDKSVISESDVDSLEALIAACEGANKLFNFELEGSAWYTASFFFATGCHSNWTTDANGEFVSIDDDFNSANGLIALKGMQKLLKSSCYNSNSASFDGAAVQVSGTWNLTAAQEAYGENFGVTDLPSFTVDGTSYHLGSFSGNKLMGVKPSDDTTKNAVLHNLAEYLTNAECQLERFEEKGWGPSAKAAQADEAVMANPTLGALAKQNEYAIPQGQIGGSWWDIAKALASGAKNANTDSDLQGVLDTYDTAIEGWLSLTPEQRVAFTVIGGIKGTGWGTDFPMVEGPDGTWTSEEAFELAAGDQFKVRQGMAWNRAFGDNASNADTSVSVGNKANYVVETAGTYKIQLVYDAATDTAVINLIPVA